MSRTPGIAILAACFASGAFGQAPPPQPVFEVASVKRSLGLPPRGQTGLAISEGRVRLTHFTLKNMLLRAYELKGYQISGPPWIETEYYDVVATMPPGATGSQIPAMLRNLLAERFRLEVHKENRERPVYALVVGSNGPTIQKSKEGSPTPMGFTSAGGLSAGKVSELAYALSTFMDRPVLDLTGIEGDFDIRLEASLDDLPGLWAFGGPRGSTAATDNNGKPAPEASPRPSIFAAVQQLGLKLESRKAHIETVVVDKAEKEPVEN